MIGPESQGKSEMRALLRLFFPFLLMTFSNCLFLLVEKLFLAQVSSQAMQVAVNVAYVCQIFQGASVALATMAQVFVGRCFGAKQEEAIGPGLWQFLWFALFSVVLTVPGSLIYGHFYFQNTEMETVALPYFYLLIGMNFLYPLGAALTCFYAGRGATRLILLSTLATQLLKVSLGYLLIFGWGILPPLGILGGALSTLIAQGSFCTLLFCVFLSKKHRQQCCTHHWHFHPKLFWECIYPGFVRAVNRILSFTCWASIAHLMAARGGEYLLILSIGGTLFLFLPFLADALCQAHMTVVSQLIGAQHIQKLKAVFRSGYLVAFMLCAFLAFPLLCFPLETFHILFLNQALNVPNICLLFFGVFVSFVWFIIGYIPISTVLAFKDMRFTFVMGLLSWIYGFLLMYFFIEKLHIAAHQFWLALSLMHAINTLLYHLRSRYLLRKALTQNAIAI